MSSGVTVIHAKLMQQVSSGAMMVMRREDHNNKLTGMLETATPELHAQGVGEGQ